MAYRSRRRRGRRRGRQKVRRFYTVSRGGTQL